MAIDPSILFQARNVQAPDILGAVQQGQQIRNNSRQGELQDLQLKTAKADAADQNLLGQLFTKHTTKDKDGKTALDEDAVLNDLFTMGKSKLALTYQADKLKRETEAQQHETALAEGNLKALELELGKTKALSGLARGALGLKAVEEPARAVGWEDFRKQAIAIDPDLKDHLPETFDENFLGRAVEAGRTEMESLENRKLEALNKEDADFRSVSKDYERQINAAKGDLNKLAAIHREIGTKYPNSKAAKEFGDAIEKGSTGEAGAFKTLLMDERKENRAQGFAQHYQDKTAEQRDSAKLINDVDSALESVGLVGGIYGDPDKVDIPGYGVGAAPFRKFLQSEGAVNLRTSVAGLYNAYRHQLFGSALTVTEAKAFEEFAGTGTVANERALLSGLQKINGILDQRLRPLGNARTKEILKENGVMTYEDLPSKAKAAEKFKPGKSAANPVKVKSADEAKKLEPGTYFELDGKPYRMKGG